jgi:hypothetical protein
MIAARKMQTPQTGQRPLRPADELADSRVAALAAGVVADLHRLAFFFDRRLIQLMWP